MSDQALLKLFAGYQWHRKARQVDHEFRERFGSPLAGVVGSNGNNNTTISKQQQDVSLLLHAAAAPAYPDPISGGMTSLYIPQKPPLLPRTMDMLSKAGPLGYSITSLRESFCTSEAANNSLQANQSAEATQHPGSILIPAYFGGQRDPSKCENSSEPGNSSINTDSTTSSVLRASGTSTGGLDASASIIIREEGPPNAAANVFRSPFAQRKQSTQEKEEGNVDTTHVEHHGVAPPPSFISPPKGLSTIGPLARSISNLHMPKSCPTKLTTSSVSAAEALEPVKIDSGLEEKKDEDGTNKVTNSTKTDDDADLYENPFATTSAAKAAHKHALLELQAAEKQGLLLKSTVCPPTVKGIEQKGLNNQIGSNTLAIAHQQNQKIENGIKKSSGKFNKPGTKVTPKRGMAGIEEVAQVLEKKLENAKEDKIGVENLEKGGEKDDTVVDLSSNLRSSMVSAESSFRSATPSKEKAE